MLESIGYRGREASQVWSDEFICLGHNRLSILDLDSRANQPMISADGRYVIVFNGEIYNFKELAKGISGFQAKTTSDTEILLELWVKEQTNCLKKLNGMFAFAVYDKFEKSLTCVRDRFGVKPFYYYFDGINLAFASEAKAILQTPFYKKQLNIKALSDYLSYGYITGSKTIFDNIYKLEPAHYMLIGNNKIEKKCYWDLSEEITNRPKATEEEILDLFESSIKYRQISDVPVGSFLSSGIDSSAITKIAFKNNPNLMTFTVGFEEESYDESLMVKKFTNKHHINNYTEHISCPTINELTNIIDYFDQPFFDTSTIPFFKLCQMAHHKLKAALTGDGGDEIFAGYETRKADLANFIAHSIPFWPTLSKGIAYSLNLFPADNQKVSLNYKLKQFFNFAYLSQEKSHYSWRLLFTEKEKQRLLNIDIKNNLKGYESWRNFESVFKEYKHLPMLQREALVDIKTWLADDILYKADQCSMANTLELRSPFLDYRLVEAAFTIPERTKFNLLKSKKFLRNILKPILDHSILKQKKEGFGSPVGKWLREELKDVFFDYINSSSFKEIIPETNFISKLFKEHISLKKDNSYRLWSIFMLSLWKNRWFK